MTGGRGVDRVDMKRLGADFGYTLDGSERGSLEDETFSADGIEVTIQGVSAHPGSARAVADVTLTHDLDTAAGGARFTVPALVFD